MYSLVLPRRLQQPPVAVSANPRYGAGLNGVLTVQGEITGNSRTITSPFSVGSITNSRGGITTSGNQTALRIPNIFMRSGGSYEQSRLEVFSIATPLSSIDTQAISNSFIANVSGSTLGGLLLRLKHSAGKATVEVLRSYYVSYGSSGSFGYELNKVIALVYTYKGGVHSFYVNGNKLAGFSSTISSVSETSPGLFAESPAIEPAARSLNGTMYLHADWRIALTHGDAISLSSDPMQVLKPKTQVIHSYGVPALISLGVSSITTSGCRLTAN
jgi:hypothetical protein